MLSVGMQVAEPGSLLLERLPGRIHRARTARTLANGSGICAVAVFLYAQVFTTYPAPVLSTAVTLVLATVVATHKTHARVRKLCTKIHTDAQTLVRDLEDLSMSSVPTAASDRQTAARRSWDALHLDLRTRMDTGFGDFGVPFLPEGAVEGLEAKVLASIDVLPVDPDGAKETQEDLLAIMKACTEHIDTLA